MSGIGNRLNTFQDASGLVTVSIFEITSPNEQQHFTDFGVNVDPDMICIGGGGMAAEFPQGALLTASYPNDDLSGWLVSLKDHEVANPHFLTAYAIGLKIQGLSRNQLLNDFVRVDVADSGTGAHPEAPASNPGNFLLVSGGFRVDWHGAGNLATASFPENNFSWKARSKDHDISDPSNLRVFAIGIRQNLPVGRVIVRIESTDSASAEHPASVAALPPGFAMTGGGAEVNVHGAGNLLWKLQPATRTDRQDFSGASKDHVHFDPATITTYVMGITIVR